MTTEVEFIVKNLDTGESFSSKLIDQYIPKVSIFFSRRERGGEESRNPENLLKNLFAVLGR